MGLLQQQTQPPPQGMIPGQADAAPPADAPPNPGEAQADPEANVSPEEQAQYDEFVKNGAELIYTKDNKVDPEILKALDVDDSDTQDGAGNARVMALANAAVQIVKRLDETSREQNKPVSDDVLAHGGQEIVEELGEVARKAGIHDYTEEELTGAYYQAIDMYRDQAIKDGRTTKDTLERQFGEVEEADQAGKIGEVLPGFPGGSGPAPGAAPGEPPPQTQQ